MIPLTGIDHIELFVPYTQELISYMCGGLGFEIAGHAGPDTGVHQQQSVLLRQGTIQLVLTAGLAAEHPAIGYVRRHGTGVANIALRTPDTVEAFNAALRRGAQPKSEPVRHTDERGTTVLATVLAFADVSHTFVERRGRTQHFLSVRDWRTSSDAKPPASRRPLMSSVDHVAVCVPPGSMEPTVAFYRTVFGFELTYEEHILVGDQGMFSKVVQDPSKNITFTVLEPDSSCAPGQIDDFLRAHGGGGVQHVAFAVDDIVDSVRQLRSRGTEFLHTPRRYYESLGERLGSAADVEALAEFGILGDRDPWGHLFQIFTRSVHSRETLFFELIQRCRARTFGSANIKALYEAVEREGQRGPRAPQGSAARLAFSSCPGLGQLSQ